MISISTEYVVQTGVGHVKSSRIGRLGVFFYFYFHFHFHFHYFFILFCYLVVVVYTS